MSREGGQSSDLILRSCAQRRILKLSKDEGWMHGTPLLPSFETAFRASSDEVRIALRPFGGASSSRQLAPEDVDASLSYPHLRRVARRPHRFHGPAVGMVPPHPRPRRPAVHRPA